MDNKIECCCDECFCCADDNVCLNDTAKEHWRSVVGPALNDLLITYGDCCPFIKR